MIVARESSWQCSRKRDGSDWIVHYAYSFPYLFWRNASEVMSCYFWTRGKRLRQVSNGLNPERVQILLRSGRCRCSSNCYEQFAGAQGGALVQFLNGFWGLPKLKQDEYVQTLFILIHHPYSSFIVLLWSIDLLINSFQPRSINLPDLMGWEDAGDCWDVISQQNALPHCWGLGAIGLWGQAGEFLIFDLVALAIALSQDCNMFGLFVGIPAEGIELVHLP